MKPDLDTPDDIGAEFISAFSVRRWFSYQYIQRVWDGDNDGWSISHEARDEHRYSARIGETIKGMRMLPSGFPTHRLEFIILPHFNNTLQTSDEVLDPYAVSAIDVFHNWPPFSCRDAKCETEPNLLIFPTMVHEYEMNKQLLGMASGYERMNVFRHSKQAIDECMCVGAPGIPNAYVSAYCKQSELEDARKRDEPLDLECRKVYYTGGGAFPDLLVKLADVFRRNGLASDAALCSAIFFSAGSAGIAALGDDVMRPHLLLSSRYGGGKSYRIKMVTRMLFKGAYHEEDSKSAKHDRAPGQAILNTSVFVGENGEHLKVVFFDEAGSKLLGTESAKSSAEKDTAGVMTSKLSKGFVSHTTRFPQTEGGPGREIHIRNADAPTVFACSNGLDDIGGALQSRFIVIYLTPKRKFRACQSPAVVTLCSPKHDVSRDARECGMQLLHATMYVWEAYSAMGLPGYGVLDMECFAQGITAQLVKQHIMDNKRFASHPFIKIFTEARQTDQLRNLAGAATRASLVWLIKRTGIVDAFAACLPDWDREAIEWATILSNGVIMPSHICFAATSICDEANKDYSDIEKAVFRTIKGFLLQATDDDGPIVETIDGRKMYLINHQHSGDATVQMLQMAVQSKITRTYDNRDVRRKTAELVDGMRTAGGRHIIFPHPHGLENHMRYYIDAKTLNKTTSDIELEVLHLLYKHLYKRHLDGLLVDTFPRCSSDADLILIQGANRSLLDTISPDLPELQECGINYMYVYKLLDANVSAGGRKLANFMSMSVAGNHAQMPGRGTTVAVSEQALKHIVEDVQPDNLYDTSLGLVMGCCPVGWKHDTPTALEPQGKPNEMIYYQALPQEEDTIMCTPGTQEWQGPESDAYRHPYVQSTDISFAFDSSKQFFHIPPGPFLYWYLSYRRVWMAMRRPQPECMQVHNIAGWMDSKRSSTEKRFRVDVGGMSMTMFDIRAMVARARGLENEYATRGGIDSVVMRAVEMAHDIVGEYPGLGDPIIRELCI
jgi:hypothetical protein